MKLLSFSGRKKFWLKLHFFALGLIVGIAWIFSYSFVAHSPRQELVAGFVDSRPTEGRLTGKLPFAPYQPPTRPHLSPRFRKAAHRIKTQAEEQPNPKTLGDLAFLQLVTGRPRDATITLEKAVALAPQDASLRSDLAAAYIALADDEVLPFNFVRALAVADGALRLYPKLPEALFNRALALEKLALKSATRQAWNDIITVEHDGAWRSEARRRLRKLLRPAPTAVWEKERSRLERAALGRDIKSVAAIIDRFPQPARLYAEEELLSRWASQIGAGRKDEAERTLAVARVIGSALVARGGDSMIQDAIRAIDSAHTEKSGSRLQHLIEGHHRFGVGLRYYQRHRIQLAVSELLQAEQRLREAGTPFAYWATIYRASCDYFQARFDRTYAVLEVLQHKLPAGRYPSLNVRIHWILGSIEILLGRPGDALPRFQEGRALDLRTGELDDLSGMLQHLALILWRLGDADEAWRYLHEGLRLADRLQSSQRYFSAFDEAGLSCLEQDYPNIALYFQNELLILALRHGDPEQISYVRKNRVRSFARLGRLPEARREVVRARDAARRIEDEGIRGRMEADIFTAEAEAILSTEPHQAALCLTEAIRFYEKFDYRLDLPMAYFQRARAYKTVYEERLAERDFHAGLAEIEKARVSFTEPRLRIVLQDQSATLFDEILTLMVEQGRVADAFEMSERGHARQLLEELAVASLSRGPQPAQKAPLWSLSQVRQELPEGLTLVKYTALKDRLLVWSFNRGSEDFKVLPISSVALAALVARVRTELANGGYRSDQVLRDAYAQLIEPVARSLRGARDVVIVPDRELALLPFAALNNPRTGNYLIQDHTIVVSPSANVYLLCLRRVLRQRHGPPGSILAIGAAEFDPARFPSLSPLSRAKEEAERVATEYPQHRLLIGETPTRERFFAEVNRGPEVLHFAGHSVLNADFPELSMLVLVPNPGKTDSGAVYSHEVYNLRLGRTRLAVLSACDTASGRLSDSEGALGLARPFLAAGIPTVLASLGPVDDALSSELMTQFHRHLRVGEGAAAALRSAQLAQIAGDGEASRPGWWALFEIIGAAAPN